LSFHSLYFRFFGVKTELTERELQYFTELDFVRNVALVATLHDANHEQIIAVGRYMGIGASGQPCTRAEVAFAVVDTHQGRGLGTLLLEHLAAIARANGIIEFAADVLGENNRMLQFLKRVGSTSNVRLMRVFSIAIYPISPHAETLNGLPALWRTWPGYPRLCAGAQRRYLDFCLSG
jgi:GNAT superfamily N-acetyltransferase